MSFDTHQGQSAHEAGAGAGSHAGERGPREQVRRDVRIMAERLAMLYYWFARVLVEELGQDRAGELIARAIDCYGAECGARVRRGVEGMAKPLSPANYSLVPDLPSVGWEAQTTADEAGSRTVISYCPLAACWRVMGAERLGRAYCRVDQAKYRAYNPDLECVHVRTMLDGDPCCEIHVRPRPGLSPDEGRRWTP